MSILIATTDPLEEIIGVGNGGEDDESHSDYGASEELHLNSSIDKEIMDP